ncbi:MAG: putative ABC transporter permease [Clostridia bacterium]
MDRIVFYFVVCSFIGWALEVFFKTISNESLDRAGMGKGPYCMAYGIGMVLLLVLVTEKVDNLFVMYILSSAVCTAFEYVTGVVLEKVFGVVLWEYTKLKFAINDHICLEFIVLWGFFGIVFLKAVVPFLDKIYYSITSESAVTCLYLLALCVIADYAYAGHCLIKAKKAKEEVCIEEKNI